MHEALLQYIWQFQYFNSDRLITSWGEPIQIIYPGIHNSNQGPDFAGAKIRIGDTTWAGNAELHINASHWNLHSHSGDPNFNNIILHVVWNHDADVKDVNGNDLPTLELKTRVSKLLLERYASLMETSSFIPCENQVQQVNGLTLANWKQRLVAERLISKSIR